MADEPQMSPVSRSALVTAIGILLGFTLAFFERWNSAPGGWKLQHFFPFGGLILGGILMVISLYRALVPHDQSVRRYESTVRLFVVSIVLVLIGFILAIVS
jgi:hypothetical protein